MTRGRAAALAFEVRDYECDLQGIVNNAVYQQYLEHARHKFLQARGVSFAALAKQGIHLVVVRAELDYKRPLRSGDAFMVESHLERMTPVRYVFHQEIRRGKRRELMLSADVICAAMNADGRPIVPRMLEPLCAAAD